MIDSGKIICQKETKQLFHEPGSIRAAILTGCKNIAAAERVDKNTVRVIDWGIELTTSEPVRDSLCAIGIRAHYFDAGEEQNSFPIRLTDETEKPFEYSIQFRYENQAAGSKDLCMLMAKDKKTAQHSALGVSPSNIMLLYDD